VALAGIALSRSIAATVAAHLLRSVLVLFGILLFNFLLLHAAGGDAAEVLAGESGAADAAYVDALRHRFGLDQPLPLQFAYYAGRVAVGDLGYSFRNGAPVRELIWQRLPATLLLSGSALLLAVCLGAVLGAVAARRVNTWVDDLISALATIGYAMPLFWAGLMLVVLFAVHLGWLPSGGYEDVGAGRTGLARAADIARHLVLPAGTLALFTTALATRIMRASMVDVLRADYVRTAVALGIAERRVVWRAAVPNAVLPLVTIIGLQVASLLGGAVLVETVFAWPGLGRLAFEAVTARDLNLLLGMLLLSSALVVLTNMLVDLAYAALDPRIRPA
jgi:peptide/nickel transport system permease protein